MHYKGKYENVDFKSGIQEYTACVRLINRGDFV